MGKRTDIGIVECPYCMSTQQITAKQQRQLENGAAHIKIRCNDCVDQFVVSLNAAGQFDCSPLKQTVIRSNSSMETV